MKRSMIKHHGWWILLSGMLLFAACETDPIMTGEEVSYAGDIRPLIDQNCSSSSCHGAGSIVFELVTYNQVKLKASAIKTQVWELENMPKGGIMSEANRNKFKDWVDAGALNN